MGAHPIYHNVRKYKNWLIPILISKKYLHIWTQKAVIPGICLVPGMDHFVMRSKKLGKASASGELTIYAPPENETYSSHLISAARYSIDELSGFLAENSDLKPYSCFCCNANTRLRTRLPV